MAFNLLESIFKTPDPTVVPTTSTTQQVLPPWYEEALRGLTYQASELAQRPYTAYPGERIAGFTPLQEQSFQATQQAAGAYQPALGAGMGLTLGSAQPFTSANIGAYMSPYQQAVTDIAKQQAELQYGQQKKAADFAAQRAGAFGGSRHGVQSALSDYYQNQLLNQIQVQGAQQAYDQAMKAYQSDAERQLRAGQQIAGLGGQAQALGLSGAAALGTVGGQQQAQQQQLLSQQYQDFLNQQQWAQSQLGWLSNILRGQQVPTQQTTYGQQFTPQMSPLSAVAGLGTTALGVSSLAKQGLI